MNYQNEANASARSAADALGVVETIYAGTLEFGEDHFTRADRAFRSIGKDLRALAAECAESPFEVDAETARIALEKAERFDAAADGCAAQAEVLEAVLKVLGRRGKDHPMIWPILVALRSAANRAAQHAEAAQSFDPHAWAYHAQIAANECLSLVEQAMDALRDD